MVFSERVLDTFSSGRHRLTDSGQNLPVGSDESSLESLVLDSDRKLSYVGKCRNFCIPTGIAVILTLSDIRQLPIGIQYQRF